MATVLKHANAVANHERKYFKSHYHLKSRCFCVIYHRHFFISHHYYFTLHHYDTTTSFYTAVLSFDIATSFSLHRYFFIVLGNYFVLHGYRVISHRYYLMNTVATHNHTTTICFALLAFHTYGTTVCSSHTCSLHCTCTHTNNSIEKI